MGICTHTGCPAILPRGTSRCEAHGPSLPWQPHRDTTPRLRGRGLQRERRALFEREPLCRICMQQGRVSAATIRDHVIPLAEGGEDIDSNIQPLCRPCSDLKTAAESQRGRDRNRVGG